MRERLIELLRKKCALLGCKGHEDIENCKNCENGVGIADHLLANGVIVPPCKVGDTVYMPGKFTGQIVEAKVATISITKNGVWLHLSGGIIASCKQQLGKTVFLTKEEAEAALRKEDEEK